MKQEGAVSMSRYAIIGLALLAVACMALSACRTEKGDKTPSTTEQNGTTTTTQSGIVLPDDEWK